MQYRCKRRGLPFRSGHFISKWCIVWGLVPHLHLRSWLLSTYPHRLRVSLEYPTPVLRRLRYFHAVQLVPDPGGSSSLGLSAIALSGGRLESLSSHLEIILPLEDDYRGLTLFRKLFRDLRRVAAGTWLKRGCRSSSTCRLRSLIYSLHAVSHLEVLCLRGSTCCL